MDAVINQPSSIHVRYGKELEWKEHWHLFLHRRQKSSKNYDSHGSRSHLLGCSSALFPTIFKNLAVKKIKESRRNSLGIDGYVSQIRTP